VFEITHSGNVMSYQGGWLSKWSIFRAALLIWVDFMQCTH